MPDEITPVKPASPVAAPEPKPTTMLAEIEAWFADHFHNSVVSRNTDVFNHVRAAKDDLVKRIKAL